MHFITVVSHKLLLIINIKKIILIFFSLILDIPNKSNLIYTSTNNEKLVYSMWCSDSTNYLKTINNAYMFASSSLLNVLLIDYDLMNRLK